MGAITLAIAFVVEAAFAAYCVITRSSQKRVRSYIRVGALAAFILATLAAVIQWGVRWYGLAALLLIWAALGAWALIGKRADAEPFRAGRTVAKAVGMLLLVLIAVTPALVFPQHRPPKVTGTHEVATATYTYTDESRIEAFSNTGEKRKVNVQFWYPTEAGHYPLIVFSHGAIGTRATNASTIMELASNGYVVCSIDHPYHALLTIGADGQRVTVDPSFLQEVLGANNGKYDAETTYRLEQKWLSLRTADVNLVLDTILARAGDASADAAYQRVDPGKIGLMGHSLGGAASAQVARERDDVGAVVNLDTDLLGEYVDFADGKEVMNQEVYPVPILTIFSDDLVRRMDAIDDAEAVIAVKRVEATAPDAFEVHIAGTNHMSLTDLPLISPLMVSLINSSVHIGGGPEADPYYVIEKMNSLTLEFFNAYLKGEGTFSSAGTY